MNTVVDRNRLICAVLLCFCLPSCTEFNDDEFGHAYRQVIWQKVIDNEIIVFDIGMLMQKELADDTLPERIASLEWQRQIDIANTFARDTTSVVRLLTVKQTIESRSQLKELLSRANIRVYLAQPLNDIRAFQHWRKTSDSVGTFAVEAYNNMTDDAIVKVETSFAELQTRLEGLPEVLTELKEALEKS